MWINYTENTVQNFRCAQEIYHFEQPRCKTIPIRSFEISVCGIFTKRSRRGIRDLQVRLRFLPLDLKKPEIFWLRLRQGTTATRLTVKFPNFRCEAKRGSLLCHSISKPSRCNFDFRCATKKSCYGATDYQHLSPRGKNEHHFCAIKF